MYLKKLENYSLPKELLLKLLKVYEYIGKKEFFENSMTSRLEFLENESILSDCNTILSMYPTSISKDRIRLLLTKDSTPRTKEEERVKNIRLYLSSIYETSIENKTLVNTADIIDYLKVFVSPNIKFSQEPFVVQNEKNSARYFFNIVIDELNEALTNNTQESIISSVITIIEMINIKPFTEGNELAAIILLTYLLGIKGIIVQKYLCFIQNIVNDLSNFQDQVLQSSVNYDQGVLYYNKVLNYLLDKIIELYEVLDKELQNEYYLKHAFKTDLIEKYIMEELDKTFTKEEISKHFPTISATTIVRTLTTLRNKNFIIPLGTGRSAKWQRIVDKTDPKYFLRGSDFKDED